MFYSNECGWSQHFAEIYQNFLWDLYKNDDEILNKINFGSLDCIFLKNRDKKEFTKMCTNFMVFQKNTREIGIAYPRFKIVEANLFRDASKDLAFTYKFSTDDSIREFHNFIDVEKVRKFCLPRKCRLKNNDRQKFINIFKNLGISIDVDNESPTDEPPFPNENQNFIKMIKSFWQESTKSEKLTIALGISQAWCVIVFRKK